MAIGSYPRVTVQGTSPSQNPQNGQGLMLLNPSTGQYEAATSSTFSGGGGGGDATSANQSIQIGEAQTANISLGNIDTQTKETRDNLFDNVTNLSAAQLTNLVKEQLTNSITNERIADFFYDLGANRNMMTVLLEIKSTLLNIETKLTNGEQRVVIQNTTGTTVNVSESNALLTTT